MVTTKKALAGKLFGGSFRAAVLTVPVAFFNST